MSSTLLFHRRCKGPGWRLNSLGGISVVAANSGFLTAEVKELCSFRDTSVTHYRQFDTELMTSEAGGLAFRSRDSGLSPLG